VAAGDWLDGHRRESEFARQRINNDEMRIIEPKLTAYRNDIRAYSSFGQDIKYPTASPTPTSVSGQGNTPVSGTNIPASAYRVAKFLFLPTPTSLSPDLFSRSSPLHFLHRFVRPWRLLLILRMAIYSPYAKIVRLQPHHYGGGTR
jgi:hypothetical protein